MKMEISIGLSLRKGFLLRRQYTYIEAVYFTIESLGMLAHLWHKEQIYTGVEHLL